MSIKNRFLKDTLCLNVLASEVDNAKEIFETTKGHVLVGMLSKNYESVEAAATAMAAVASEIDNALSVGLGAGDPKQWHMVAEIAALIQPQHVNQVAPAVGYTRGRLNQNETIVNALLSPSGTVGLVNIATGPKSSQLKPVLVPIEAAIVMLKEMGASSVKFYPMKGLETRDEYQAVCEACGKLDFMIEPTGGLDLDNFEKILRIALEAKVPGIIAHVYSSIIDKETGRTKKADVEKLYEIMERLAKEYLV